MKHKNIIGTVIAVLLFSTAYATVWYVHPDSAMNCIQDCLDSCATGDTVLVGPGIYSEHIVWPNTQGIDLVSQYGIDTTFIDGGGTGRVILINTGVDSTTIINGFTIQNGYADFGAGIHCVDGSSPTITHDSITGNSAIVHGGGIRCTNNSSPIIANNTICLNHADTWSGGIACNASAPFITGNTITQNTATDCGGIGAAFESSPTITDNIITDNSALNIGGGIALGYDSVASATITGNTIRNNTASGGGGISCIESSPTIQSCCIDSNSGGGVYCYAGAEPVINYNNIVGNIGYGVRNGVSGGTVNAEYNWWGDPSGPYHPTANPGGLGDSVTDYVDFDPWLTNPGVEEYEEAAAIVLNLEATPNPFHHYTTIRYTIHDPGYMQQKLRNSNFEMRKPTLKIYDAAGRLVRSFHHESCIMDRESVIQWDGRDYQNRRLPCGIYFVNFRAGDCSTTEKLLLIR